MSDLFTGKETELTKRKALRVASRHARRGRDGRKGGMITGHDASFRSVIRTEGRGPSRREVQVGHILVVSRHTA